MVEFEKIPELEIHEVRGERRAFFDVIDQTAKQIEIIDPKQDWEGLKQEIKTAQQTIRERLPKDTSWSEAVLLLRFAELPAVIRWIKEERLGQYGHLRWKQFTLRALHDASNHHPKFLYHLRDFWERTQRYCDRYGQAEYFKVMRSGLTGENAAANLIRGVRLVPRAPKAEMDGVKKTDLYFEFKPGTNQGAAVQVKRDETITSLRSENLGYRRLNFDKIRHLDEIFRQAKTPAGGYDFRQLGTREYGKLKQLDPVGDDILVYWANLDNVTPLKVYLPGRKGEGEYINEDGIVEPELVAKFRKQLVEQKLVEVK